MEISFPVWGIILAAGRGSRLSQGQVKKQFLLWQGQPLFWYSARVFAGNPYIKGLTFVFPAEDIKTCQALLEELEEANDLGIKIKIVPGGETRQDSVFSGLNSIGNANRAVLIHDAARPFITPGLVKKVINSLIKGSAAVVPALPITDTVKQSYNNTLKTLPREKLYRVQTPQGFSLETIVKAHQEAYNKNWQGTDDAALVESMGLQVEMITGEENNIKITTPEDLRFLKEDKNRISSWSGWGYDVHRYGPGRPMKLGGIPITNGPEVEAHSDGDVLLHAVIDALLGCLGQGDIGDHFPDNNPDYDNINSSIMLAEILMLAEKASICLSHLDATLICQIPKLSAWKRQIKENLSRLLNLPGENVNIKATTEEGLGFTGQKKGIKAVVILSVYKSNKSI